MAIKACPEITIPDADVDKIISEVDYFGNGKINYTEFLVATLDVKTFLDKSKLQALFNQFDTDGSGEITKDNIITAMNKLGHSITQKELDEVMRQHDTLKNGVITLKEFEAIFFDLQEKRHWFKGEEAIRDP